MSHWRIIFVSALLLTATNASAQDTTRLSLLFIGDIMQHETQINAAYNPSTGKYDYDECFRPVKPVLENADLTIGNLELTLGGTPYKGYPNFSAPDELIGTLMRCGVDALVTANNHCLDRGKKGLQRTIAVLDTLRMPHTGTFVDSSHRAATYPMLLEKNGFKLSLLNYTYGTNGIPVTKPNIVNYIDTTTIAADLEKARQQGTDAIIVFLHWGDEYQPLPNRSQKMIAAYCLNRGAKLVIGAHPHVLQPMEWRKEQDQLIVYSLGNFVSGQSSRYRNGGGMVYVDLEKITTDSTATTRIADASYKLQFVYRDAARKYHIVPVQEYEADTTLIREQTARQAFKLFASDSRELLSRHNVGINERPYLSIDTSFTIHLAALDTVANQTMSIDSLNAFYSSLKFYGTSLQTDGIFIGEFFDRDVANRAMEDVRRQLPFARMSVVRRKKDYTSR